LWAPDQLMFPGVLVFPFLLGKRLVRDGVISIDVFSSINPQAGKLAFRRSEIVALDCEDIEECETGLRQLPHRSRRGQFIANSRGASLVKIEHSEITTLRNSN
jgi:hypothetical protein